MAALGECKARFAVFLSIHIDDAEKHMTKPSVQYALNYAADQGLDKADAEILLAHVLQCNRARFFAFPEQIISAENYAAFYALVDARATGEPVAYLTGQREFYGLNFAVNASVLSPRPETELLVELALKLLPSGATELFDVLDLGTGSGAIACALAHARASLRILATDQSSQALALAQQNAQNLAQNQIQFALGSWFDAVPLGRKFDLIASNPPYLDAEDPHLRAGDLRFEPVNALTPAKVNPLDSDSGLTALQHIIERAPLHLKYGAWLLLEHGFSQAAAVRCCFERYGFQEIATLRDYSELDRVSYGRFFGHFSGS